MTIERCLFCNEPTGRAGAGEDSIYFGEVGPFCEHCCTEIETALTARIAELEGALDTATADNADYEAVNTAYTKRIAELEGALGTALDIADDLMSCIPISDRKPYSNYSDSLQNELAKARALLSACVQPVIDKDVCGKETANNETQLEAPAEEPK